MAVNYAVYSNRLKGFAPFMNDDDVYIYCDSTNMVVVCIDCYDNYEDRTCVESVDMEPIVYLPGYEPHEGRVWKLKETMQIVKERLQKRHIVMKVYGIMLTEAKITNAEELELVWEFNDMKVIDGFVSLRHRKAGVNNDEDLRGKIYFDAVVNDRPQMEEEEPVKEEEPNDEEFERLLMDFINSDSEEGGEKPDDDELLEITKRRVEDYHYKFTAKVWEKYVQMLSSAYQLRDPQTWGNARFIGNQLERIYIQHASRCVKQQPKGKRDLLLLTPEDIVPIEIPRQRTKIGF